MSALNENSDESFLYNENLEMLKRMLEQVDWNAGNELHELIRLLDPVISNWKGPLPNLCDIFRRDEIDELLLQASMDTAGNRQTPGERFIGFVARTGYKNEPIVYGPGNTLLFCTTPVHNVAKSYRRPRRNLDRRQNIRLYNTFIVLGQLFQIYDRFDLNYKDEFNYTHFHVACEYGFVDVVKKFLEHGQDPNCAPQESDDIKIFSNPPLHLALQRGHINVVEVLLKSGADQNLANNRGFTPLHVICRRKHDDNLAKIFLQINDSLEKTVEINARDQTGWTPLQFALLGGLKKATEQLLRRGADPNLANHAQSSPLHVICRRAVEDINLAELFFKINDELGQTVQVDAVDKKAWTPLHFALNLGRKGIVVLLLTRGANPNFANKIGYTPLHIICTSDEPINIDLVKLFFQFNEDRNRPLIIDAQEESGFTALHMAVLNERKSLVEFLLRKGADANLANSGGLTALHLICMRNNDDDSLARMFFAVNDELRTEVQVNARDQSGNAPLHLALTWGNKKVTELLLRRGADPNLIYKDGLTPLHFIFGGDTDDVALANIFFATNDELQQLVHVNARDALGTTPLISTLHRGHHNLTELLLRRGANPNLGNANGLTPLHVICMRDTDDDQLAATFFAVCEEIRETVQIHARDHINGNTPLHLALHCGHPNLSEYLLEKGANPNVTNESGLTPLHIICMNVVSSDDDEDYVDKIYDLATILFELAEDRNLTVRVNARDVQGCTPLHLALSHNHNNLIEYLLVKGADPNAADIHGTTPLHIICARTDVDDPEIAEILIGMGEERQQPVLINAQDDQGRTPLYLALSNELRSLAESLLVKGADPNLADVNGSTALHIICMRFDDDDLVDHFFDINETNGCNVWVDARDAASRTPLQLAVANLLPHVIDVLMDHGASLNLFAFPNSGQFSEEFPRDTLMIKLRLTAGLMGVVERLESRGYVMKRRDALTVMELFGDFEIFGESAKLDTSWYYHEDFVDLAEQMMITPDLSLMQLLRTRPDHAARILSYEYLDSLHDFPELPPEPAKACVAYLCERASRRFFRGWAVSFFLELTRYRLPILCCEIIIDKLVNKDLRSLCLAARAVASSDESS